ncbi:MAG TPA: phosphorylated adapter RNA export RNA-binding domain-containing protein, partial [Ktedonobacteraceae bacterium]|nr:phosphorylated adapter RNA export RNA-binding domain-containing protein [Ktedonobacteraceae bacterium]
MVETIDKDRKTLYNAAMSEQPPETRTTPNQELAEVTTTIAEQLGETEAAPISQIRRAVKALGTEQALALLKETLSIETQGGLMLPDQSRRRTPGGVFFHLI